MKYSIVGEILNSKRIILKDEKNVIVELCAKSPFKFISPFNRPYIVIDTLAKKSLKIEELRHIDFEELTRLGFAIYSVPALRKRWFANQFVMYVLGKKDMPLPNSKKLTALPTNHKLERDVTNNRIRLIGKNAGYPHYEHEMGGCSPWTTI